MSQSSARKTVAVFFGGQSVEHDVSVLSGLQFIEALDPERFGVLPVYVAADGRWWTGDALLKRSFYPLGPAKEKDLAPVRLGLGGGGARPRLEGPRKGLLGGKPGEFPFDIAVSAIHGSKGEDGSLQGLFEFANIPYAGCPTLGSAAAMDKVFTKQVLGALGVPVLPGCVVGRPASGVHLEATDLERRIATDLAGYDYPYCVKPRALGSSIGVARVADADELLAALLKIFRMDSAALIEPFVANLVEYNVAVADIGGEVRTSAIERPLQAGALLDFRTKYLAGGSGGPKLDDAPSEGMVSQSRVLDPEELSDEQENLIRSSALTAREALGLAGSVRIDFLCDGQTGTIWLNEINTIPGSFAYYLWQAAAPPLSFSALTAAMIDEGFRLHEARQSESDAAAGGGAIFRQG